MLAIVLLLGMIFVGAIAVIVTGGMLVDSVQENSQHELALDSAVQTHQQIAEALQSGESRELAVSDAVDMEVRDTGSLSIEMLDGPSPAASRCSAAMSGVERVEAGLGAIVYETPRGEVIYEGGAIWERTDGGLSAERAPPISYDGATARISIQTVTADADDFEGQIARPDEQMQAAMAENTSRLLTRCPSNGYTTLNVSVTSPYSDLWEQHFNRAITGPNVSIDSNGDTVWATIGNVTSAHSSRGLRFDSFDAPSIVGPNGPPPMRNHFNVSATVVNDGFEARNATVELVINGTTWNTSSFEVPVAGSVPVNLPASPLHRQADLVNNLSLTPGRGHDYTVRLIDGDGNLVSEAPGRFFLEKAGGGNVTFFDDGYSLQNGQNTLLVNATLINTFPTNATGETVEFQITDEDVDMSSPIPANLDVPGYGGTKEVSYELNVSNLQPGTYDYVLRHGNVTLNRTFTISRFAGGGETVGNLRVEGIDASAMYVTNGSAFDVRVQLYNMAPSATNAEVGLDIPSRAGFSNSSTTAIGPGNRKNVTVTLTASELATLETRRSYDYNVTVSDTTGNQTVFPGSFVFLEPGTSLQIEDNATTRVGDTRWVNVSLANHGIDPGADNVTFSLYDNATGDILGSLQTDEVRLGRANSTVVPFNLNATKLGGTYRYEVSYGEDTVEGTFSEGDADTGDGNVSITAPGNGSVTVLGTEVSAFDEGECMPENEDYVLRNGNVVDSESSIQWQAGWWGTWDVVWEDSYVVWENADIVGENGDVVVEGAKLVWDGDAVTFPNGTVIWEPGSVSRSDTDQDLDGDDIDLESGTMHWDETEWDCDASQKYWSPVSVATILDVDGNQTVHQFENDAADDTHIYDDRNLDTFDTQDETYTYHWSQVSGETTTLTVRSRLWEQYVSWSNRVNVRNQGNAPEPPIEDYHPNDADVWDSPYRTINAQTGTNIEAVRVLEDGDDVPNPETSGEDQRSAKEILEQNGVDMDGEQINLGPYEAIFLFELTEDSYEGMWDDADDTNGDPDYNDVIALMSFHPDNPEDVELVIGDHSVSFGPAPTDPQNGSDPGEQNVSFDGSTEGPGSGGAPTPPTPQNPDPGSPSEPEDVEVDVGGIVIG